MSKKSESPPEHPLLKRLVSEQTIDVKAIQGYVGPSDNDECIRVYSTLDNLEESIEVRREDVIHHENTPENVLPHGAMTVWVKGGAEVAVKLDRVAAVSKVDLKRGRLRIRVPGSIDGQVCQSVCGVCQSVCKVAACQSVCGVCQSVCGVCQSVCSASIRNRVPRGRFWR